jgi:membrane-bound lytic murein transglycosylase MltF
MKPILRIAALAVMLSPVWISLPSGRGSAALLQYPLRQPANPDTLRARGTLRYAISAGLLERFAVTPNAADFDYDLLSRFASDLGVLLVEHRTDTEEEAVHLLRTGRVDLAMLMTGFATQPGMVPARACSASFEGTTERSSRLEAFARSDSPGLIRFVDSRVREIVDPDSDDPLYRSYCSRGSLAGSGPVPLPFSRQISRYARLIAKHSAAAGLDWRLVAAVISEESSFDQGAVSAAGARGLMQLMPWVPAEVGVANISRPESNIQAGVLYLSRLSEQYPEARASDRLVLALASYMLGPGHVADARELARQLGLNPHAWRWGLEETLPLLEDERFNRHTRLGYAHGRQAVNYVNRILNRYRVYRRHLERDPQVRAAVERNDDGSA